MAKPKVIFQWDGVEELKKALLAVGASLDDRNDDIKTVILEGAALKMRDNARNLAPVKTGLLRKSIYASKGGAKQRGVLMGVRKAAFYAHWIEFGTSKMPAHPFFRPALLAMTNTFAQDIAPGIGKIVEATAAKNAYHPPT
jgi:HK97 gp10 family phage protein